MDHLYRFGPAFAQSLSFSEINYFMKHCLALCVCLLLLQPCSFATTEPSVPVKAEVTAKESCLQDVLCAYSALEKLHVTYREYGCKSLSHDELVAGLKETTALLRPICARLEAVSADELKQLVLLADAIIWQSDWVNSMYCAEYELDLPSKEVCGLELLAQLSGLIVEGIQHPLTPQEEKAALLELYSLLKGEAVMTQPAYWLDERLAKDYKTAYYFLKEFTEALTMEDDAAAAELLQELAPTLEYLLQEGEPDCLRMKYLTKAFTNLLRDSEWQGVMAPVSVEKWNARKVLLADMTKRLPALEALISLVCKAALPSATE